MPEVEGALLQHLGKPLGDLATRFAELEKHPSTPALMQHRPKTGRAAARVMGEGTLGLVLVGLGVISTPIFLVIAGPIAIFPMLMLLIGVFMAIGGLKKSAQYKRAPLERFRAGIVDERVKLSGDGANSRAHTSYFATLQSIDGRRVEYEVNEEIAAAIAPGDVGIAFSKAHFLIDFKRVDV